MILQVQSRRKKLITLTPLIDVVFILLLFFMLSSSFLKWKSVEITIEATTGGSSTASKSLFLRLIDDRTIGLSGKRMRIEELPAALAAVRKNGDPRIMIESKDDVSLQSLMDVFDHLDQARLTRYGMVVR